MRAVLFVVGAALSAAACASSSSGGGTQGGAQGGADPRNPAACPSSPPRASAECNPIPGLTCKYATWVDTAGVTINEPGCYGCAPGPPGTWVVSVCPPDDAGGGG